MDMSKAARIISIPIKKGDYVALFDNQKGVGRQNRKLTRITSLLRNDPEHIIMPANKNGDLDLWKVNVVTGHAVRIEKGKEGTFFWFTDNKGKPALRFDCFGRECLTIYVYALEGGSTEWKKIKTFRTKIDEDGNDFDFLADRARAGCGPILCYVQRRRSRAALYQTLRYLRRKNTSKPCSSIQKLMWAALCLVYKPVIMPGPGFMKTG